MTTIYTKSQVRAAMYAAAASIESDSDSYDFWSNNIPSCGTPGCMLGWIGFHLGMKEDGGDTQNIVARIFGTGSIEFYGFSGDFCRENGLQAAAYYQPLVAARVLRSYADRYFPAETQRAEGPLTIYDLLPLADWIADAQRSADLVSDVESGVGA